MEGAVAQDNAKLAKQEADENEEKGIHTPDKSGTREADSPRPGVVTRSAKKNTPKKTASRASSTKLLRSAGKSAEGEPPHEVLNKPPVQREESAAIQTDCLDEKMATEISESEKMIGCNVENQTNDKGKENGGSFEKRVENMKTEAFSCSPEEKEHTAPGANLGDKIGTPNQLSDQKPECSVTEPRSVHPENADQSFSNQNIDSKVANNNEICNNGLVTIFERKENEEEIRRRMRLSLILESSSIQQDTKEENRLETPTTITLKEPVSQMPISDCSMIAGDGQEEYTKTRTYLTHDNKPVSRSLETGGSQVGPITDGNLRAGGDAGEDRGIQQFVLRKPQGFRETTPEIIDKPHIFRETAPEIINKAEALRESVPDIVDKSQGFRESVPESVQMHQNIKREQSEKTSKGTSIRKGELTFEADPSFIPIKPIPALSTGTPQENENTLDNLNMPYIPPDVNLLYQSEAGVMKSKPVPKPTRGRRGRRRSPSLAGGMVGYRHFVPHPDIRFPEQARLMPGHPYQRYMLREFGPGLPGDYCEVVPGHGGDYVTYHAEAGVREGMGGSDESLPGMSPGYSSNRWFCKDDIFKVPSRPVYAPAPRGRGRGSSGGRGRPRGRRGSGGVRQYLQHRLLWARYTGRSQEALDRVLSIINSKCGLQEDSPKEAAAAARFWGPAGSEAAVEAAEVPEDTMYARMDRGSERPCRGESGHTESDPYGLYHRGAFSSNISNMMTGGSSSTSILSQSGIASNAVVDGNGYIVYLNQDDSSDYPQHPPIPFVPSEATIGDRGDPVAILERPPIRGGEVKGENDVRKTEELAQSQPSCVNVETSSIVPNKLVVEGLPADTSLSAEMGTTAESCAMAAVPPEGSLTPSVPMEFSVKEEGKRVTARKRSTPKTKGLKTPVSPVKEPKASKRPSQASGGRQRKKVRRSLTFSSPIKNEETLQATENIANAMTSSGPEAEASATCSSSGADYLSSSTPLPSISSLLHSSTNAGISINIHVTNDANKERGTVHSTAEDVPRGGLIQGSLEQQTTSKGALRTDMVNRPAGEATPHMHYPVPRYTMEWHGDYHQDPGDLPVNRSRRFQDHVLPVPAAATNSTASRFRYPYRDPNSSHGYYSQQRPFPAPASPLDRYYTSDYGKEWSGTYAKYPPEHYLTGYEIQHPSVSASYPAVQWTPGWNRNPEMFPDPYQKRPSSRAGLDAEPREMPDVQDIPDMRDIAYSHYHRAAAAYPRTQPEFPEEVYSQHRPSYGSYGAPAMVTHHAKERLVAAVPEVIQDARQPESDYANPHLHHRPWAMGSCTQGTQVLQEGPVPQLAPGTDSPPKLQSQVACGVLEPDHMETGNASNPLSEEPSQMRHNTT